MSYRRNISFANNEIDLLDIFDSNGKSEFAKNAMRYYIKHKNQVLSDEMKIEILKLFNGKITINKINQITNDQKNKLGKLIK